VSDIIKIQRPLESNAPGDAPWMIYDKDRKHQELKPADQISADVKAAMGKDPKGYFLGVWSGGGWKIGERVKAQTW
jgi:hypothetical protein